MRRSLITIALILLPAASRADAILYSLSQDFSGIGGFGPSSTVSWSFEVPSILTTKTAITNFLSASLGAGFSACGTITGVSLPGSGSPGFLSSAATFWSQACGSSASGGPFTGALADLLVSPASFGIFDTYGQRTHQLNGTLTIADVTNLQGGPSTSPVILDVPLVAQINGTIGGAGTEDYYSFLWNGGAFSTTAIIGGTPNAGASYLLSVGSDAACANGATATLNSGDSFSSTVSIANLPAGQYCAGIDANNSNDPAFSLTFNTPVSGTPEPFTLISLAVGLMALAGLCLRERARQRRADLSVVHYRRPRRLLPTTALALACFAMSVPSRATPIYAGLIGYWPFNGNANDGSGNGYNLTLTGGATFAPGLFGQALSLDGVEGSSAIRASDDPAFDFGSGDFSVQVWADFAAVNGEQTLIEKFSYSGGPGWTLTTPGGGDLQFFSSAIILNAGLTPVTGVWQEFVITRSGSNFDLYHDGALVASGASGAAMTASPNPLLIGARDVGDGRNFTVDGLIDEVGIWDRGLSATEVSQLWNGGLGTAITPEPCFAMLVGVSILAMVALSSHGLRRRFSHNRS